MSISQNKVVTIHYTVTDAASNEVIDSSEGGQPMVYLHGHQNIIPGLENALEGKTAGDELKVEITAADAYGEYSEERVQQVPIEAFEGVDNVKPGMAFTAQTEHCQEYIIVTEINEGVATVDANHPLAGNALNFDVKVAEGREASVQEVEHGALAGEGCNEH